MNQCKNCLTIELDDVPSFLVKGCAQIFAKPLRHIFNLILRFLRFRMSGRKRQSALCLKKEM